MASAPPFQLTPEVLAATSAIERLLGRAEGFDGPKPQPLLRKSSRVRTVQASVAVEGNTLTLAQVTAVLAGKRVAGTQREMLEVTNANAAYERAASWVAKREHDLLEAHGMLMKGLVPDAGRYRSTGVGIVQGSRVAHVAPPANRVQHLVKTLLGWVAETRTPALIRACVAHYELLFIHPFTDGNGRLARLWQHVVLLEASPLFQWVPIESVIRERQSQYYDVLGRSDRRGDSTEFLVFALQAARDALTETFAALRPVRQLPADRLEVARGHFGATWFSRSAYLALHQTVSTATASRDLLEGVATRSLLRRGVKRTTEYRFRARRAPR